MCCTKSSPSGALGLLPEVLRLVMTQTTQRTAIRTMVELTTGTLKKKANRKNIERNSVPKEPEQERAVPKEPEIAIKKDSKLLQCSGTVLHISESGLDHSNLLLGLHSHLSVISYTSSSEEPYITHLRNASRNTKESHNKSVNRRRSVNVVLTSPAYHLVAM
ncbi:hypothetical protein CEXT_761351 [Caerostris extrusa]|uniref:Uncharacterized protein n=1 Tax=Caerostris extrusa TaxID=172846 RepID=A0AAV4QC53_CAEEX|nr:hypothetical protein CEXT_761351 [Caerostris extrusa]